MPAAALARLLDAHRARGGAEAAHLERIRAFVRLHDDPFSRGIAHGHLTSSAFVLDGDGRVLLTHHRRLGLWVQLGGHADGERLAHEVALREAREESGLTDLAFDERLRLQDGSPALLDVDVHAIPASPERGEPAHDHLDLRFLMSTRSPHELVINPRESRALEWVTRDEARRRCTPDLHRALDKIDGLGGGPA